MRWVLGAIVFAGLASWAPPSRAEPVEVLTPDLVAQLDPAREKPLALTPTGDAARFLAEAEGWQEAAPPLFLDVDRDGRRDFLVASVIDAEGVRRALIIYDWGEAPGTLGDAVFYVIFDDDGRVVEWAGRHRLAPRRPPPHPTR